ncbi:MAG: type II toxin-antitoxin system RelE/ParE family toxin [Candidatus Omnitrophica bacterium]|nr:type II toxin-antitoxin system RelE/ParE family toxin [Candidatus Omnitrophota bacterium]
MYKLLIIPKAEKQILDLPRSIIAQITSKIEALAQNPRPFGAKKLAGQGGGYRLRSGDYRILYTIDDTKKEITIYKASHRKEAYR